MEKNASGKRMHTVAAAVLFSVLPLFAQAAHIELTAGQAVEMAMKNNRTLRSLDHRLRGEGYGVGSAITGFLPHATLTGNYTRKSGNDMFSKFLGSDLRNSYSIGLEIQQPVFTGFATLNGLRSARVSRSLQEKTNEKTAQVIRYAVLQIYRGLVNLQKSSAVAAQAVRQLEELSSNQSAMKEQGMATEHDCLLTDASLAQARMNELEVGKSISSMKRQFAVLLGLPVEADVELTDTGAVVSGRSSPSNVDSTVESALRERPDLLESSLQLRLSEYAVRQARASYFPSLLAGFSYSNARPDQTLQDRWGDDWHAYLGLNFNLFDWGDRVLKVRKAKENHLSLLELHDQKRAEVEKQVLDAFQEVDHSSRSLEAAVLLSEAREKAYEASVAKHEEGVIPMYELLDAHSAYVTAKYRALQAATDLELAVINLEMGGLGTGQ